MSCRWEEDTYTDRDGSEHNNSCEMVWEVSLRVSATNRIFTLPTISQQGIPQKSLVGGKNTNFFEKVSYLRVSCRYPIPAKCEIGKNSKF